MAANIDDILEVRHGFDAPRHVVFDAWMEREQWQSWLGPDGVTCDIPVMEPRVGGRFKVRMKLPDGNMIPVVGEFRRIDRPNLIEFTWCLEGDPRVTVVSVDFKEAHGKTEMTLRHASLADAADRDNHGMGWRSAFGKLAAYLARRK